MMQFFFNSVKTDVMFKSIQPTKDQILVNKIVRLVKVEMIGCLGIGEKTHFSIGERHNFRGLESIFE